VAQDEAGAESLKKQNAALLTALDTQAAAAKVAEEFLFARIGELSDRLDALEGPPKPVGDGALGCGASACSAEIVADDGSEGEAGGRTVTVRGAHVMFESDACAATDLCDLRKQVEALMDKFKGAA
jgi:hypothetical protein